MDICQYIAIEEITVELTIRQGVTDIRLQNEDRPDVHKRQVHRPPFNNDELAFEIIDGKQSAKALLAVCEEILNSSIHGYKGGQFIMRSSVPVWVANHGDLGHMLMGFGDDGQALLED